MLVPRSIQVRDTGCADARLAALMDAAPKAAASGRAAWQFKMALQLIAYRFEFERAAAAAGAGGGGSNDATSGAGMSSSSESASGGGDNESVRGAARGPYLSQLPGAAPGVPAPRAAMTLSPAALAELQHPQLEADAGAQAHFCTEFAEGVLAGLPARGEDADPFGGRAVTRQDLEWGLTLAMSRSFGFKRVRGALSGCHC